MATMHPRPLRRSVTFWSGLLVMGFVVWAWSVSYRHLSIASFWRIETTHAAGGLALLVQPAATPLAVYQNEGFIKINYGKHGEWIYDLAMPGDSAAIFPPLLTYSDPSDGSSSIFLPHWLILLAVALAWAALLLWRARRGKLQAIAEPHS